MVTQVLCPGQQRCLMCVFIEQSAKMRGPRLGFSEVSDVYCFIEDILKWDGLLNTLHMSGSACRLVSTLRHQQIPPLLLLCPPLLGVAVQWKRHVMSWYHQDQLWLYGPPDVGVEMSQGLRVMLWEPVPWKSDCGHRTSVEFWSISWYWPCGPSKTA